MRTAEVWINNTLAAILSKTEKGYSFQYDNLYLSQDNLQPVSLTLPVQLEPFHSRNLFAFFDGLIPEGWLLNIAQKNWKLNSQDRMGLLLAMCKDCIGNISIIEKL